MVFAALLFVSINFCVNIINSKADNSAPLQESLMIYFCRTTAPTLENLSHMILMIFPFILFIMFFGTILYDGLTPESTYSFVRQKSRFSYFIGKIVSIFCLCTATTLIYTVLVMLFCGWGFAGSFSLFIYLAMSFFTIIFEFSVINSVLSMKIGASFSLITCISAILVWVAVSLNFLENGEKIPLVFEIFSPICLLYNSFIGETELTKVALIAFVPCFLWAIFALITIKISDIGLNNKELM
jgi:hypothetical protein